MARIDLTNTAWTKIASAGSPVEIQNLSTGGTRIVESATVPTSSSDAEVLYDYNSTRAYPSGLVNDLYAQALQSTSTVVVLALAAGVGGGGGGTGGAVTEADGADITLGAKADAAATSDAGSFSLIALFKRLLGYSAPSTGAVTITPGTPVAAGRRAFIACTAAGTVRLKLSNGSTLDVPVSVGPNLIDNVAVVDVVAANSTGTFVVSVLN